MEDNFEILCLKQRHEFFECHNTQYKDREWNDNVIVEKLNSSASCDSEDKELNIWIFHAEVINLANDLLIWTK